MVNHLPKAFTLWLKANSWLTRFAPRYDAGGGGLDDRVTRRGGVVATFLALIAALASWIPARRAAQADRMECLRVE